MPYRACFASHAGDQLDCLIVLASRALSATGVFGVYFHHLTFNGQSSRLLDLCAFLMWAWKYFPTLSAELSLAQ